LGLDGLDIPRHSHIMKTFTAAERSRDADASDDQGLVSSATWSWRSASAESPTSLAPTYSLQHELKVRKTTFVTTLIAPGEGEDLQ
jgi:hypothetical protein